MQTSANAAGNIGYDEIAVSLDKRVIPGSTPGGGLANGTQLWRGETVAPGVFLDAPLILLGADHHLVTRLYERDLLPEVITENFPGRGRAIVTAVCRAFSNYHDTLAVLANDREGLKAAVDLVTAPEQYAALARPVHPQISRPVFDERAQLQRVQGKAARPSSYRDLLTYEDRPEAMQVDPATGRLLVGTFGYGHNLFCFSKDGNLLWKQFLPEHDVYIASWYDDGKKVLAATGHGYYVFILNGDDGSVLGKFSSTEWPDFHVDERETQTRVRVTLNPALRQILILGRSGLMAIDYDGRKMWFYDRMRDICEYPQKAEQTAFATFGDFLVIESAVPSHDGTRLACNETRYFASFRDQFGIHPLWRNEPQILDARTGKLLLRNTSDPGSNDTWSLSWPEGSPDPYINAKNLSAPLQFSGTKDADGVDEGKLGNFIPPKPTSLKTGGKALRTHASVQRLDASGQLLWEIRDKRFWVREVDRFSASDTRLYRSSRDGMMRCIDLVRGRIVWQYQMPVAARILPVADDELVLVSRNGMVAKLDAAGNVVWLKRLRDLHEMPDMQYSEYVAAALDRDRDSTPEFYTMDTDTPEDFVDVLRMGMEQLDNGDFETDAAWTSSSGELRFDPQARSGKRSLRLAAGQLAVTAVERRIVPSATYLLEFFYRIESEGARLVAGARLDAEKPVFTLSTFKGRVGEWTFGRVAVKSMADTASMAVGFEATGGEVLVDAASLRPVRFPSSNLLGNAELHRIEPTHPEDFRIKYSRVPGGLKNKLLHENNVTCFLQATPLGALIFTEEQAYLHNGRLDDVGTMWCYRPDPIGFGVVLTQPAYVSHLVIYLNNSLPETVYPFMSIQANDMATKLPKTVAVVRGNRRRFVVVHFPETLYTDNLKILPGKTRTQRDSITEVEVYGPVGGPDMLRNKSFTADPLATPMLMGSTSHVQPLLHDDLLGTYEEREIRRGFTPAHFPGLIAADEVVAGAHVNGVILSAPITSSKAQEFENRRKEAQRRGGQFDPSWSHGSVTALTTPAQYAGRLLVGSADYRMHAVSDSGARIWSYETGGRVYSSATPDKDEAYFGSDDGNLYKVDIDSGILIWEFKTTDRVRSSPALDGGRVFVASWDGFLYCVDAERGTEVWKAAVAPFTCSSPAVHRGRAYVGDDQGALHCFNASDGKPVWQADVGGQIMMCPVVVPEGVFAAAEDGSAAMVGTSGTIRWKRNLFAGLKLDVPPRVTGQAYATKTQVLIPTNCGVQVLRRETGQADDRFTAPATGMNYTAVLPYGTSLCLVENHVRLSGDWTRFVVDFGGAMKVWEPKAAQ